MAETITIKRHILLDKTTWRTIQAFQPDSGNSVEIEIDELSYNVSHPVAGTSNAIYSIQEQPWATYDLLEKFIKCYHEVQVPEGTDNKVAGFIVPADWVSDEDWATSEKTEE